MKRSLPLPIALCALACSASVSATLAADIHIPADRPTIQQGIDAASAGDRVLVAEGTYAESIDFRGKSIQVLATGSAAQTIISGRSHSHAVVFQSGETSAALLAGFQIEGGHAAATSGPDAFGGGILVAGTAAPEITGNIIRNNSACAEGGGIAVLDAARPLVHGNNIAGNKANCSHAAGGGVYIASSALVIVESNLVLANKAYYGAGIAVLGNAVQHSETVIARNEIRRNRAVLGGGIYTAANRLRVVSNLISGNEASNGAGLLATTSNLRAHPIFASNTIAHNEDGGGTEVYANARPGRKITFVNNIIVHLNGIGVICEKPHGGGHVIFADGLIYTPRGPTSHGRCTWKGLQLRSDPQFVGGSHTSDAFWLSSTSPAIDVGDSEAAGRYNESDLTGAQRISGPAIDFGAIEFRQE